VPPLSAGSLGTPSARATELPSDPIRVLLEIAAALDGVGVDYLLGGSLASSVLGEPRSTADIDLAVALREAAIPDLVRALEPTFFVDPESVREAVRRRASFNVLHRETMMKVDLFVLSGSAFDREQMQRRLLLSVSPDSKQLVAVSSAEDLVLRKLAWYREGGGVSDRQWRDVLGVLKVQRGRVDLAYLMRWAAELHLRDLLERALTEAGSR
jgi:hypothetical protein